VKFSGKIIPPKLLDLKEEKLRKDRIKIAGTYRTKGKQKRGKILFLTGGRKIGKGRRYKQMMMEQKKVDKGKKISTD
jgi:translation initiation factor IF-2